MRKTVGSFVLATVVGWSILGTAVALPRWLHYRTSEGSPAAVVIRARCLAGEDTAAHLRLVEYSAARVVYGCYRKGY